MAMPDYLNESPGPRIRPCGLLGVARRPFRSRLGDVGRLLASFGLSSRRLDALRLLCLRLLLLILIDRSVLQRRDLGLEVFRGVFYRPAEGTLVPLDLRRPDFLKKSEN